MRRPGGRGRGFDTLRMPTRQTGACTLGAPRREVARRWQIARRREGARRRRPGRPDGRGARRLNLERKHGENLSNIFASDAKKLHIQIPFSHFTVLLLGLACGLGRYERDGEYPESTER